MRKIAIATIAAVALAAGAGVASAQQGTYFYEGYGPGPLAWNSGGGMYGSGMYGPAGGFAYGSTTAGYAFGPGVDTGNY